MNSAVVDAVLRHYPLPFELRQDQIEDISALVGWDRSGIFNDPGLGKTVVATCICLWKALYNEIDQIVCLLPPILIDQWEDWLHTWPEIDVEIYRGTPTVRKNKPLAGDFILTTMGVFKNDHDRFMSHFKNAKVMLLIDEATCIRQPGTLNFAAVRDFVDLPQKQLIMLTGTPLGAHPATAYGYIKLKTPDIYRDYRHFKLVHVTKEDQFNTPCKFQNLELIHQNLLRQAVRRRADDILDLPPVTFVPVPYHLQPKHQKVYDKLIEDLLVEIADTLIDGTTQQRLYHAAQKLIMTTPDPKITPAGFNVLDQVIEEAAIVRDNEKLLVYCNYQASNEAIFDYLARMKGIFPVLIYGGNSDKTNAANVKTFLKDPKCNVAVCNPRSGGVGLNLQVCRYQLFLETPITSEHFQQAIARIKRDGQKKPCTIWMGRALGTVQVKIQRNIMKKEDVVQQVVPSKDTIRKALQGA